MLDLAPIVKRWCVVLLLVCSLSTPWALIQSVAWFGMLIRYSQQTSFRRAVSMTFDGQHPCKLCHLVKQGQSQEQQQPKRTCQVPEDLQLGLPPEIALLVHPPVPPCVVAVMGSPDPRADPPLLPPPRC